MKKILLVAVMAILMPLSASADNVMSEDCLARAHHIAQYMGDEAIIALEISYGADYANKEFPTILNCTKAQLKENFSITDKEIAEVVAFVDAGCEPHNLRAMLVFPPELIEFMQERVVAACKG